MRHLMIATAAVVLAATAARAEEKTVTVNMPKAQIETLQAIEDGRVAYGSCPNELKCSTVKKERNRQVVKATSRGKIAGWFGQIAGLETTGNGEAIVIIAVPDRKVTFGTWNNGFSDVSDRTLIKSGSNLYEKLSDMSEGQWVKFSGRLVRERSLTEAGSMDEPAFIVRFSDISAVTEKDAVAQ